MREALATDVKRSKLVKRGTTRLCGQGVNVHAGTGDICPDGEPTCEERLMPGKTE